MASRTSEWVCLSVPAQYYESMSREDKAQGTCSSGTTIVGTMTYDNNGVEWIQDSSTMLYVLRKDPSSGADLFCPVRQTGVSEAAQAEPIPVGKVVHAEVVQAHIVTAPVQQALVTLPPTVPAGSKKEHESYIGNQTMALALFGCLCCGPLACCVLLCPLDERDVCVAPGGRKFDTNGKRID